jgi:signal transduction histidine kinase
MPLASRRRSALTRFALGYAAFYGLTVAALAGLLYAAFDSYVERDNRQRIESQMNALLRIRGLNELQVEVERIIRRARADPFPDLVYALADGNGGCPVDAGEPPRRGCPMSMLATWPIAEGSDDGWFRLTLAEDDGSGVRLVAKVATLNAGYRLLVGRSLAQQEAFLANLGRLAGIAAAAALVFGLAGGWLIGGRFVRRLEKINATCAAIGVRGLKNRMEVGSRDDEFDELAKNINAMLDRISELMSAAEAFTDQVAHDLRTPLTRVRARLEDLAANPGDPAGGERARTALVDLDGILAAFAALLQITRTESAAAERIPVALTEVIKTVVDLYGPAAEDRGMVLTTHTEPVEVAGERALLVQLVSNLVDNAVKFTAAGGSIEIRVERTDHGARLVVADTGPGIPPGARERVFQRYHRGDAAVATSGHGLGLSLVGAIARRHGMTVSLEDNHPGLRVVVAIPTAG